MGKKIGLWSQSLFRVFFKEIISIWVQNRSLFLQLPSQTHLFFYCFVLFTGQRLQRLYTDNNLIWSDHTSTVRLHSHTSHKGLGNRHNELISETETSAYKQIRAQSGGDVILLHIKPPTPLHATSAARVSNCERRRVIVCKNTSGITTAAHLQVDVTQFFSTKCFISHCL